MQSEKQLVIRWLVLQMEKPLRIRWLEKKVDCWWVDCWFEGGGGLVDGEGWHQRMMISDNDVIGERRRRRIVGSRNDGVKRWLCHGTMASKKR